MSSNPIGPDTPALHPQCYTKERKARRSSRGGSRPSWGWSKYDTQFNPRLWQGEVKTIIRMGDLPTRLPVQTILADVLAQLLAGRVSKRGIGPRGNPVAGCRHRWAFGRPDGRRGES